MAEVSGTVRAPNGTPIGGISVELTGTSRHATTTDSGRFSLTQIKAGTYVLTASGTGWRSTRAQVHARAGALSHLELVLTPAAATGAVRLPPVTVGGEAARPVSSGPHTSPTGSADYTVTSADILNLPTGDNTAVTDVLAQMPDVAIDQNQQIHIRNTEGPQFQYQIDGALVPLDINTNPPFISMIDPMFVSRVDLLDGVLPSRYSYATGGIVAIQTKNGCDSTGGDVSVFFGQRRTLEPSAQYAGCAGSASYYVSGLYDQGENAFSSATSGPNPIHDQANQGHVFGYVAVPLGSTTRLRALLSAAASNNQLPNVPNLSPQFTLTGAGDLNSGGINSYLNFRDYLGMLTLSGKLDTALSYQVTYAAHSISQQFAPDDAGELIFQGVASTATHNDLDNTLQADLTYKAARHTLSTGIYLGEYRVIADDHSLVFPVDSAGTQSSSTPIAVINNAHAINLISGLYVNDIWQIDDRLRLDLGLRWDDLTGFTDGDSDRPDDQPVLCVHASDDGTRGVRAIHAGAKLPGHLTDGHGRVCGHDGRRTRRDLDAPHRGRLRVGRRVRPRADASTHAVAGQLLRDHPSLSRHRPVWRGPDLRAVQLRPGLDLGQQHRRDVQRRRPVGVRQLHRRPEPAERASSPASSTSTLTSSRTSTATTLCWITSRCTAHQLARTIGGSDSTSRWTASIAAACARDSQTSRHCPPLSRSTAVSRAHGTFPSSGR